MSTNGILAGAVVFDLMISPPPQTFTPRYSYSQWPAVSATIPRVAAGVYAVWHGEKLIYCGMSGRQLEQNGHKAKYGLVTRRCQV